MSATAEQLSQDAGEGKGSAWTSYFIAKGNMSPIVGHNFTCKNSENKDQHQTTQKITIEVTQNVRERQIKYLKENMNLTVQDIKNMDKLKDK